MITKGFDTSSVAMGSKKPDWVELRKHFDFVVFRAAFGGSPDQFFLNQRDKARSAGFVVGAYAIPSWRSTYKLQAQALMAADVVKKWLRPGDLPLFYDIEGVPSGALPQLEEAVKLIEKELGYTPGIYTSQHVWRDQLGSQPSKVMGRLPLWVKRYPFGTGPAVTDDERINAACEKLPPEIPRPWAANPVSKEKDGDNYWLHQYQGNADLPHCGLVDMNRFNELRRGAKGARVVWAQQRLPLDTTEVDGIFGEHTENAVKTFQRRNGLDDDGIIGLHTFARLCRA